MKNILNKFCLLAFFSICLPAYAIAQDIQFNHMSQWIGYDTMQEQHSIVRSDQYHRVIHVQNHNATLGINYHTFIVKSYLNDMEMTFGTWLSCNDIGISDMELYNGECYFCGSSTSTLMNSNNEYERRGIVGHFSPQAMIAGSGTIQYYEVEYTVSLRHLAVTHYDTTMALISAVGEMDNGAACIAEIAQYPSAGWRATLDYLPQVSQIMFSDILNTGTDLILLSQLKCSNPFYIGNSNYDPNHQVFLLDKFSRSGCHHDHSPSSIHYMAHYYIDNEDYSFHSNKASMLLCNLDNGKFGVSYASNNSNNSIGAIRLFLFPDIWTYCNSLFYKTGGYSAIRDIGSLSNTNQPFILSQDQTYTKGLISVPDLNGLNGNVVFLTDNDEYSLHSLSQHRNSSYIDISGHGTGNKFHRFDQYLQSSTWSSCFEKSESPYTVYPEREGSLFAANWDFRYAHQVMSWNTAVVKTKVAISDPICTTY